MQPQVPHGVSFSVERHAMWAPGMEAPGAWTVWAAAPFTLNHAVASPDAQPDVRPMPPMLRRRAGFLSKMALQVAYHCLDGLRDVPSVFCSRHGDVARAVGLLSDLVQGQPLSPTSFGLAVHNASAGLLSIARQDVANHLAIAAGTSTVEHAVIECCSLLAEGAPKVLLVAYDTTLPALFSAFDVCHEQPHAWAWLMVPAQEVGIRLDWCDLSGDDSIASTAFRHLPAAEMPLHPLPVNMPAGLEILQFYLSSAQTLLRVTGQCGWRWSRYGAM